jgi:Transcriptional regulators
MGVDLQLKLSSMKPNLSVGHSKLCDYVIDNFNHIPSYSGSQLAQSAGVSLSTLHRFIRLLDFENFTAFKFAMKSDINNIETQKYSGVENPSDRVFNKVLRSAKLAHQSLDMKLLSEVAKYISLSERIYLLDFGEERLFLDYLENTLRCANKSVLVIPQISLDINQLDHKDLIISIEQTGDEEAVVSLLTRSYSTNAMLVRFSNTVNTQIQKLSDIDINIAAIADGNGDEYRSERYLGLMMAIDVVSDLVRDAQASVI